MLKKVLLLSVISLSLTSCLGIKNGKNAKDVVSKVTPTSPLGSKTESGDEVKLNGATAKQITLENNLKVTLISSPSSSKSAISVGVNVGHMDNPIEHQGLAHYLEHMLFLGTKDFPDVDEYKLFLASNGGGSNAYTSNNHTNYYLDVRSGAFEEAVHRMSRFFVDPLFNETYAEREKNAVENEFRFRFETRAPSRTYQSFYREDSRSRLFSVGNFETLGDTQVEDTKTFYKEQYYSEAMHAVLAGPQSHEELEELAKTYLSDIVSNPEAVLNVHEESLLIDQAQLPARVLARPTTGSQSSLGLLIPFNSDHESDDVLEAIATLLGDKSDTSLMKFFVEKGWITADAGNYYGSAFKEGVYVSLDNLTEDGKQNKQEILNYIYTYMKFLSEADVPSYLSDEVFALNETSALLSSYYEINGALAEGLNRAYFAEEPSPETLSELIFGKDPQAFSDVEYKAVLADLNWAKPLVFDTDPSNPEVDKEFDQIENLEIGGFKLITKEDGTRVLEDSIYEFAYEVVGVDEFEIKTDAAFLLKAQNPYTPTNFEVYNTENNQKYQKVSGSWGEMYWSDMGETGIAYTRLNLDMYSHGIDFDSTTDVASLFLMRELLKEQVLFGAYPLNQMGFAYDFPIKIFDGAVTLEFSGWSDGYFEAFGDFLRLSNLTPDPDAFESIKKSYADRLLADKEGDLDSFASRGVLSQITKAYLGYDEILPAFENLEYETYVDFTKRFAEGLYFRGALSGDVLPEQAEMIVQTISEAWGVKETGLDPDFTSTKLASAVIDEGGVLETSVEGPSNERSTYVAYRNLGETESVKDELTMNILSNWLGSDYYTELRTNQGLAYSLYAYFTTFAGKDILVTNLISLMPASETSEKVVEFVDKWANQDLLEKDQDLLDQTVFSLKARDENFPLAPSQAHDKYYSLTSLGMQSLEEFSERVALYDEITLDDVMTLGQQKLLGTPNSGVFLEVEKNEENLVEEATTEEASAEEDVKESSTGFLRGLFDIFKKD